MTVAWITLDHDGIVNAGYIVEYCDPMTIRELRRAGREPKLVDFGKGNGCKVGVPLPPEARILETV